MIADTEGKLQWLVGKVDEECKNYGLKINISKTEVMWLTKKAGQLTVRISFEDRAIDQVDSFKYFGSMMCESGKCDTDMRMRIGMAKASFGQLRKLLTTMESGYKPR